MKIRPLIFELVTIACMLTMVCVAVWHAKTAMDKFTAPWVATKTAKQWFESRFAQEFCLLGTTAHGEGEFRCIFELPDGQRFAVFVRGDAVAASRRIRGQFLETSRLSLRTRSRNTMEHAMSVN